MLQIANLKTICPDSTETFSKLRSAHLNHHLPKHFVFTVPYCALLIATSSFFQRLKNFLQENSKVLDDNTVNLMYPVFVHMYVELINNGHKTPGMYWLWKRCEGNSENLRWLNVGMCNDRA